MIEAAREEIAASGDGGVSEKKSRFKQKDSFDSRFPRTVDENSIDKNSAKRLKHFAESRVYYIPTECIIVYLIVYLILIVYRFRDGSGLKGLLILCNNVQT